MVFRGENMIVYNLKLKDKFKNYSNINNKISREIKNKKLYRIINGIYETDPNTPPYLLASCIYGPSYISFEYALACYGAIPERVYTVTCATFNKKKKKEYNTRFGNFTYRDVPSFAYPKEIILIEEGNYSYQIATLEKALCDKLYTLRPLHNLKNLEIMLFDDLRIDEEVFATLRIDVVEELSKLYHSTNVNLLVKYLKRKK